MKTLIFSDTHLTPRFDPKFYSFLVHIISQADQVIINGDFWEGMSYSFEDFIHSDWKKLFPLLKKKKTIYIFGNHDRKKYANDHVSLFSVKQCDSYLLTLRSKKLHIMHGHQIVPFNDKEDDDQFKAKKGNDLYVKAERFIIKTAGSLLLKFYRIFNKDMKKYSQNKLKKNEILVTGHIHAPEFDLKNRYINTFMRHGRAYYLVVDNEELVFKKERF